MRPFIDIHAHLQFADYDGDREAVLTRAKEVGVDIINVGTGAISSQKAVILAKAGEAKAVVGLHPIYIESVPTDDPDCLGEPESLMERFAVIEKLASEPEVVAIGECGLDYFHVESKSGRELQKEWFIKQIELSLAVNKPLMLHIRNSKNPTGSEGEAYTDVLAILRNYPEARGDVHFFAGTKAEAQDFLELGFYLSFTGVVTFAESYKELVQMVPLNRILTETDCPYVAPVPYRGKRNEPAFVVEMTKAIAQIKGLGVEEVASQIRQNALDLFGF